MNSLSLSGSSRLESELELELESNSLALAESVTWAGASPLEWIFSYELLRSKE